MSKRELILESMTTLIAEQGIQGTPMSQIAKASGVATGTIYHHFTSKEEIINAIYLEKKKDFQAVIQRAMASKENYRDQFMEIWKGLFDYYLDNPSVLLFTLQVGATPIITPEIRTEGLRYYQIIIDYFKKGQTQKLIKQLDALLIAEMVHANIIKLAELKLRNKALIGSSEIAAAVSYCWDGVSYVK
ncbi:MAG: TetR/AcrR family transcriptional regulator [Bacteroidota bacterium]